MILKNVNNDEISSLLPFIKDYKQIDGKTAVYICNNFSCLEPITDINELEKELVQLDITF